MNLEQIKREWVAAPLDAAAETAAWDTTAEEYVYEPKNNFVDDPFLHFVAQKVELTPQMTSLDVGCGAGAFSVAMAQRVGQADGSDLSPRMIQVGRKYLEEQGIRNVNLWVDNWRDCDIERYKGKYDVVFAHTTPAVCDFPTLEKLCLASRHHCFTCVTARRTDRVFDEIRRIAGREGRRIDEQVARTFEALWYMGYTPEVDYSGMTWLPLKTLVEAKAWFLGRLRASGPIDVATQAKVEDYLASIARDGMVQERIDTTLVNMHWTVR